MLLPLAVGALVLATALDLAWRLHAVGFDHSVGVYVMLAELARDGIIYPHEQTADLVYCTFYQPLAFLPYTCLPGSGIDLLPAMRALIRCEVAVSVALVFWLVRRAGASSEASWLAVLLLLGAMPVTAASINCVDDPRGGLLAMLAYLTFASRDGRLRPRRAAILFALAFFTKLTAPVAAGLAAVMAAMCARRPGAARALVLACAVCVLVGYLLAHLGFGWDLLGNGLRYAVFDAKPGRALADHLSLFMRDLVREPVTAVLLLGGAAASAWRLLRVRPTRAEHALDVWLLAALLRAFVEYHSHGTELNHLFEASLLGAVSVARAASVWLRSWHVLLLLPATLGLGFPVLRLSRGGGTLAEAPMRAAVAVLRAQPKQPTLCEEPLLAWCSGSRPMVTDPFLASRVLRRRPDIRAAWFGPREDPHALLRLVLIANPESNDGRADGWYRDLHFDAEFLADVRRVFAVVAPSDFGTVLQRR